MKLLKKKLVLLAPIIVFTVTFVFSLTLIPSVNPVPKKLPIAIVNEDQGIKISGQVKMNLGEDMAQKIIHLSKSDKEPVAEWVKVKNQKLVHEGLNDRKYYAALIIPKDFSQKQATFQTKNPAAPKIHIVINQGANTMAANASGQILNQVVELINQNSRKQILTNFKKQGASLTVEQASAIASPITSKVENVNQTGSHSANGNAPISLIQPLWMSSLIGAVLIFLTARKIKFSSRTDALLSRVTQGLIGTVLAMITGYSLVWIANDWVGLSIPQMHETALFITICYGCFYLMVSAVISWIGVGGAGIFGILFFFGTPLLTIAPEFMSTFYRDWFYPWLPMRFAADGLRDLLFFHKDLSLSQPVSVLIWIGIVSFILLLASALKRNVVCKEKGEAVHPIGMNPVETK
ncbi:DUF3533 domain-containing protein [Bacillus sp. CLL-7-23]|uniref:DUF3533 domain-containing protein n=1 Tax=Bacillus changyiensis TaxID=3004103 RepID=A0ABT4X690_9BACI|nr:ABC transporter permease [Bacillus changyiensis]MDA7027813.1 DUF3533 domain-containing protein [Bacillus changyiensis]